MTSIARDLADLTDRLDRIAPADLDTLTPDQLRSLARQTRARADAIDALATRKGSAEPVGYVSMWFASDVWHIEPNEPQTLREAEAAVRAGLARYPEMPHRVFALVEVTE